MNFLKKYSYWVHAGKYSAMQKIATLVMATLAFMLLARILGPAGYGVWGLFLIISSIAETARTALIRNAFIRYMHQAATSDEKASILGAGIILGVIISTVMSFFFVLASYILEIWFNTPLLPGMLRWYAATIFISSIFSSFEMQLNARMDFKAICWMYCVRHGLMLLLIFICFIAQTGIELWTLSVFYMLSFIAGSLAGLKFVKAYIQWSFRNMSVLLPRLLHFGKYVFGTNISSLLFRSTDNFMVFTYFGAAASGFYNVCLRISNLIDLPSQVFADLLFPKASGYKSTDTGAIKNIYEKTVGAVLVFSLPALLIVLMFPSLILQILAGDQFVIAAPILRITAFFGFTLPFIRQFGTIMDATGHPQLNFRIMLFAFLVNIVSNIICISLFGLIGAAVGSAITYFLVFIFSQYLLHKKFGIQWMRVFNNTWLFYSEISTAVRFNLKGR